MDLHPHVRLQYYAFYSTSLQLELRDRVPGSILSTVSTDLT